MKSGIKKLAIMRIVALMIVAMFVLVACAGPQTVKPYAVVKATAESILYEARVLNNQGQLSDAEFQKVSDIYDKVKAVQDAVIDARKTVATISVAYENILKNTNADPNAVADLATKLKAAQQALSENTAKVTALMSELLALASQLGLKGVK